MITPIKHFDTFQLVADLWARREYFDHITARQDSPGGYHKDTKSIFLRVPTTPEQWFDDIPHYDTDYLKYWPAMESFLYVLAKREDLGKVMAVSLKPGGELGKHIDEGAYAKAHERYHMALVTNPKAKLVVDDQAYHLPVGMLSKVDVSPPHWGYNHGSSERIHLIVDVRR